MAVNPDRGITLNWATSPYIFQVHDGIRVRVWVSAACEMESAIFAYRMLTVAPATGAATAHFSHICSSVDLAEYPVDEPVAPSRPEWFRTSSVDVLLRSQEEADNFITTVREDVAKLKLTLDTIDTLEEATTATLGLTCPVEASESSSESASSFSSVSGSLGSVMSLTASGTVEQVIGVGQAWIDIGTGAGSPVGGSDSLGANYSSVSLIDNSHSQLLVLQGFDFAAIDDDAELLGIEASVTLRWANDTSSSSSSSESSESSAAAEATPTLSYFALSHPDAGLSPNRATGEAITGPEWLTITLGDEDDLWGLPLTIPLVKRGDFGAGLIVALDDQLQNAAVEVDGIELTVYYR